jgi:hypothetical protein
MKRRRRNRVARDFAERFITRRLVRQLMIELGHEGPERRKGYIRCDHCRRKVRATRS